MTWPMLMLLMAVVSQVDHARTAVPAATAQAPVLEIVEEMAAAAEADEILEIGAAAHLVKQAEAELDDETFRYVLLDEAVKIAIREGQVDVAMRAVDLLTQRFEVESIALRLKTRTPKK